MKAGALLLCFSISAFSQNYLIKFAPDNQPYVGMTGYVAQLTATASTKLAPGWDTNVNAAIFASIMSNSTWQLTSSAGFQVTTNRLSRIVALYNQIPAARSNMTFISNTGLTNTATLSAAIKLQAQVVDGVLEELQRIGPILQQMYQPDLDATP